MAWYLNEDISYCRLDGRLVFLDVATDRYFQLSKSLEQQFINNIEACKCSGKTTFFAPQDAVVARQASLPPPPTKSLLETNQYQVDVSFKAITDVLTAVMTTHRQLKNQHLKTILERLIQYRRTHAQTLTEFNRETDAEQRVAAAAAVFNRARPYVPIKMRCLLDSISLTRYLAKRELPGTLVMGIACDPFSAHAWVQHDALVLNDSVGNARAYTPIRGI